MLGSNRWFCYQMLVDFNRDYEHSCEHERHKNTAKSLKMHRLYLSEPILDTKHSITVLKYLTENEQQRCVHFL